MNIEIDVKIEIKNFLKCILMRKINKRIEN